MKPLRIVHCANFSESKNGQVFYAIDRKISNGLIRNGHFVYDFSYRDIARTATWLKSKKAGSRAMNQRLIETIGNIKPDLLLLGHSELVQTDTLQTIKMLYPTIKMAMWWVDPFDNIGHIDERIPYLDAFFATTSPEYYTRLFTNTTAFYFLPNMCDNSIETGQSFMLSDHKYELLFIGRFDTRRRDFLEKIKQSDCCDMTLLGDSKETMIFGQAFLDAIAQAKMALNYSRYNDIPLYSSDRIIQLLGQGTLVFSPRIPQFETLFTEEEIVYFDDDDEFMEKFVYFKNHPDKRVEIARNGWEKAHRCFNSTVVTSKMLDKIFNTKV